MEGGRGYMELQRGKSRDDIWRAPSQSHRDSIFASFPLIIFTWERSLLLGKYLLTAEKQRGLLGAQAVLEVAGSSESARCGRQGLRWPGGRHHGNDDAMSYSWGGYRCRCNLICTVTAMQELCSVNYLVASGSCERKQGSIPGKE